MTNEELLGKMNAEVVAILNKYGLLMAELKQKHENAAQGEREATSPTRGTEAS